MLPVEVAWRKLIKRKDTMPSKNQIKKQKTGFTIIEVVLVLAIAGLIFLMVFVALPALQRSQRDTQRRQDYADLASAISSYMTNNNGNLPPNGSNLDPKQYINKDGTDPNGKGYIIHVVETSEATNVESPAEANVYVYTKADCGGTAEGTGYAKPKYVNSTRAYAIYGYLDSGTYCQANQ